MKSKEELEKLFSELPTQGRQHLDAITNANKALEELYYDFAVKHLGYEGADGKTRLSQDAFTYAVELFSYYKPKEHAEYQSSVDQLWQFIQSRVDE